MKHKLNMDLETQKNLLYLQQEEINSHYMYQRLAETVTNEQNSGILKKISAEEMKHYQIWKKYTQKDVHPNKSKIALYFWISKIFGITFGIRLMEIGEERAQDAYKKLSGKFDEIDEVIRDEEEHEDELLNMLDEETLRYAGSVVLGLNDALVELTGALAGLTFAFQNTRVIALAGLITGISASFSMAASEYLSQKSEGDGEQSPIKSAVYTGLTYILTVTFLVLPYLFFSNFIVCLALTILIAILIIAVFNFYISVAKGYNFKRRFIEMTAISLGVTALSFVVGNVIRNFFGIDLG